MSEGFATFLSDNALTISILVILLLGLFLYRTSLILGDARDQQAATTDVLKVVSHSTIDLEDVLVTLLGTAAKLCRADAAGIIRRNDGNQNQVAHIGLPPSYHEYLANLPLSPGKDTLVGRVLMERETVLIADAVTDYKLANTPERANFRSWLGVPLLREGHPIGVMVLARTVARPLKLRNRDGNVTNHLYWSRDSPFNNGEVELVTNFADQAVIAIENARLFDEIQDKRQQLELANTYKSRFLAAASHDLRQPLHALNLFIAQLRTESQPDERRRLVANIDAAVSSMNELFDALLDMSKLDAGVLEPNLTEFPIQQLLNRMETTFAEVAREKGLRLSVVSSRTWVRSDFILLGRIVLNLLSNAVRYTSRGGVVIGCRRLGNWLRIDVLDSGAGIPDNRQRHIFGEFYQLAPPRPGRLAGLGLGLSIVERLGRLLEHPVELVSRRDKGSRFSVLVPIATPQRQMAEAAATTATLNDLINGKLIVVIDDDALALDGMGGILQSWGCTVLTATSEADALTQLEAMSQRPDLIISDYRLADGHTGIKAIERLRVALEAQIPAFLISGDTAPERLREARESGHYLLHKPVSPMALRTTLNRVLKMRTPARDTLHTA